VSLEEWFGAGVVFLAVFVAGLVIMGFWDERHGNG